MKQDLLGKRNGRFCERSAESLSRPKDKENCNWVISEGHGPSEEKSNVVGVKGEDKANKSIRMSKWRISALKTILYLTRMG